MRLLLLTLILISSLAVAEESAEALRLLGRLEPRKLAKDAPPRYWIQVGPTRYALELDPAMTALAKKLRGKFVAFDATREPKGAESVILRPRGKQPLAAQERATLVGYVRAAPKTQRKKMPYLLETTKGNYRVAARDGGKFRKLVDGYVTVQANVTSDGKFHQLEAVKSVDRTLAPGARAPKKGEQAVSGSWKGTLVSVKVPSGVPGVKKGDRSPVSFRGDEKLRKVTGRLLNTYDVIGVRVRKFSAKKRTIRFDLEYTFGQGGYSVRFEGKFSEDFKKLTGEWTSSFLGSGTFELDWKR